MEPITEDSTTLKMVKVIYILNFVGIVFPICTILAVVFAYIYQDDARDYLKSHFQYQIRGFWMSLLYFAIAGLLCLIVIGFVLLALTTLWWIIRNAKGLKRALDGQAVVNPTTWLF